MIPYIRYIRSLSICDYADNSKRDNTASLFLHTF